MANPRQTQVCIFNDPAPSVIKPFPGQTGSNLIDIVSGVDGVNNPAVGATQAGAPVVLNPQGRIDSSLLGQGTTAQAGEAISAGNLVHLYASGGTLFMEKAYAAATGVPPSTPNPTVYPVDAQGFVTTAVNLGDTATVNFVGLFVYADPNSEFSISDIGVEVYLSADTPGGVTKTRPSGGGQLDQSVGYVVTFVAPNQVTVQFVAGFKDFSQISGIAQISQGGTSASTGSQALLNLIAGSPSSGNALIFNGSVWAPGSASTSPAGSNHAIQFNNSGSFGGTTSPISPTQPQFMFDPTTPSSPSFLMQGSSTAQITWIAGTGGTFSEFEVFLTNSGTSNLGVTDINNNSFQWQGNNGLTNSFLMVSSLGTTNVTIDPVLGSVYGSATGGAKGVGTINAVGLYVNGVAVSTGGTPGGAPTQIQFNNTVFGGIPGSSADGANGLMALAPTGIGVALTLTGDASNSDIQNWFANGGGSPAVWITSVGTVNAQAGFATAITIKTTTYAATATDHTINGNGTFTITLPTIGIVVGQEYYIKNIGIGVITVSSSVNIDFALTASLSTQGQSITVQWDGTQYWIY